MPTKTRSSGSSAKSKRPAKTTKKRSSTTKKAVSRTQHTKPVKHTKHTKHAKDDKLASNALKLIDQAADLLRKGVVAGASESMHVRYTARKRAHTLLEKAHVALGDALDTGTSALHKMLGKI